MTRKHFRLYHIVLWLLFYSYWLIGTLFFPETAYERNAPFHVALLDTSYILSYHWPERFTFAFVSSTLT